MREMMKPKTSLLFSFLAILLFFGCEEDSEDLNNAFRIGADTYTFNDGLFQDIGSFDLIDDGNSEETHQYYLFLMSDGRVDLNSGYIADSSATYAMVIFAFAPINNSDTTFNEGVFKYVSNEDFNEGIEELRDAYVFWNSYISFDENNDGNIESGEGNMTITGGVSRIFGSPEKFDMNFTYDFSLGKKAEGRFSGPIEVFEP